MTKQVRGATSPKFLRLLLTTAAVLLLLAAVFIIPAAANGDVAEVGGTKYTDLQSAIDAAGNGDEIVLQQDVVDSSISVTKTGIILDLNGKTISGSGQSVLLVNTGSLTIKDSSEVKDNEGNVITPGTGKIYNTATSGTKMALWVYSGSLTVESGTFISHKAGEKGRALFINGASSNVIINGGTFDACQGVYLGGGCTVIVNGGTVGIIDPDNEKNTSTWGIISFGGIVNVNGGTIQGKYGVDVRSEGGKLNVYEGATIKGIDFAINGNGTVSGDINYGGTEIAITGGTVSGGHAAVYHPQAGVLTISGGILSGEVGIQMCSGTLSISGSPTITATGGNSVDKTGDDGLILDGAAISVVNRDYPGGIPTVTIGGTPTITAITGEDALSAYIWDNANKKQNEWAEAGEKISISGGTFSTNPTAYVSEDSSAAKFTSGEESTFYVGENIAAAAEKVNSGDSIEVLKGNVDLVIPASVSGVKVTNSGSGMVTVNSNAVSAGASFCLHNYGEPTYVWSADNSTCTAKRICGIDVAHIEEETVNTTNDPIQQQSCENEELTKYTATFTKSAFTTQTKEVKTKDKLGHTYGDLVAKKDATCIATGFAAHYFCDVCDKYFTPEKVETTEADLTIAIDETAHVYGNLIAKKDATYTATGFEAHYKCSVCNSYFTADKVKTTEDALTIPKRSSSSSSSSSKPTPTPTPTPTPVPTPVEPVAPEIEADVSVNEETGATTIAPSEPAEVTQTAKEDGAGSTVTVASGNTEVKVEYVGEVIVDEQGTITGSADTVTIVDTASGVEITTTYAETVTTTTTAEGAVTVEGGDVAAVSTVPYAPAEATTNGDVLTEPVTYAMTLTYEGDATVVSGNLPIISAELNTETITENAEVFGEAKPFAMISASAPEGTSMDAINSVVTTVEIAFTVPKALFDEHGEGMFYVVHLKSDGTSEILEAKDWIVLENGDMQFSVYGDGFSDYIAAIGVPPVAEQPASTPTAEPTATETQTESPLSVLAVLAGLGAVAVLRRR